MKKLITLIMVGIALLSFVATHSYANDAWEKIWGPVGTVVVVYSGEEFWRLYATELSTGDIYWQTSKPVKWEKIGGPGKEFVSDGLHLYGLSPDGSGVWQYNGTPMKWTKIGGAASHIYAGGKKLFVTDPKTGDIYQYNGKPLSLTKIGGPGKTFTVDDMGQLYGLSPDGSSVWRYDSKPMKWTKIGGAAAHIYAGGNKLFATNPKTGDIYQYNGKPQSWTKVGGPGKMFAVDDTGQLYGLAPDGSSVWRYLGTPMKWTKIGGSAANIYAGGNQRLYAASPETYDLWYHISNPFLTPFYSLTPVIGKRNVVVIMWDYHRPKHPALPKSAIKKVIFGPKPSVRDYFLENSGGRFKLENAGMLGWYDADKPANHYLAPKDQEDLPEDRNNNGTLDPGEDLNNNGKLDGPDGILQADEDTNGNGKLDYDLNGDGWISGHAEKWAEAIRKADKDFDFKKYDFNNDKILSPDELTILIVIPQNNPFGTQRGVVGKEYPKKEALIVDGVEINVMVEAYIGSPPSLGLVAHELSHILLGAGDMYFGFFQPYAAGIYSLMDQSPINPSHLDPFHKLKLGWIIPKIITLDGWGGWEKVHDVETRHEAYILYDPTRGKKEYYIIENRWPGKSYDSYLPSSGLAVWHIIEDPKIFDALPTPPKVESKQWNDPKWKGWARRGIRMIRPIYGPSYDNSLWDGSKPQTGYDLLSVDSNPNHVTLRWADGTPSGFSIRSIPPSSSEMKVKIGVK